jgi:hypothetical protein
MKIAVLVLAMLGSGVSPAHAAVDHVVTFVYRDRDGTAAGDATTFVHGIDSEVFTIVTPGPDGTTTVALRPGRYFLESTVETPRDASVLVDPELTVDAATTVTVDAAVAKPVSVTVPDQRAIPVDTFVAYWRLTDRGPVAATIGRPAGTALFSAHTGPTVSGAEFTTAAGAYFARPGPDGTETNSPLVYATAWQQPGRLPTGFRRHVREADLSTVRAEHGTVGPGRHATKSTQFKLPPYGNFGYLTNYTTTPFTRVERYAGNVRWGNVLEEYAPTEDRAGLSTQTQQPTAYRPGRQYAERWQLTPSRADARVQRVGDTLLVDANLYGDQSGHAGTSDYRQASVTLHRDGRLVGTADRLDHLEFTAPAGGTYRLTASAERDFTDLTTKTTTSWTFTSLPLPTVRYEPPVDLSNRVRGGGTTALPVHVDGALRSLTVSFDGGATWRPVRVTGTGSHRTAHIHHPAGPGHVSLRATAAGKDGATVDHTVLNAYGLRPQG